MVIIWDKIQMAFMILQIGELAWTSFGETSAKAFNNELGLVLMQKYGNTR
jgi:hypothetical protein